MQLQPFSDGEFVVCSSTYPLWLTSNDDGGVIWGRSYLRATRYTLSTFNAMLKENKWLIESALWFQR